MCRRRSAIDTEALGIEFPVAGTSRRSGCVALSNARVPPRRVLASPLESVAVTSRDPEIRTRWGRIVLCTSAGACAIWATLRYAGPTEARNVVVSLFVEGSAALFLLALLFLLERGFTARVTSVVSRQVHDDVVAPLESRVDELAISIADLQTAVDQRRTEQASRHQDLVSRITYPTFSSVTSALAEAARLNAIGSGGVTVQANANPSGIWLEFSWGAYFQDGARIGPDELRIRAEMPKGGPHSDETIDVSWHESDTAPDVARRLEDRLYQAGIRDPRYRPDWSLMMANFQRSVAVALLASDEGWQLQGALYELVGRDWAVTTAGIERRDHGVILPAKEFPRASFPPAPGTQLGDPPAWSPPPPAGADPDEWKLVVSRGQLRLTLKGYGMEIAYGFNTSSLQTWYPVGRQPDTEKTS